MHLLTGASAGHSLGGALAEAEAISSRQQRRYLKLTKEGHEPLSLSLGLAMHRQHLRHGDTRNINWEDHR